jgi:hypothetical protein
MKQDFSSRSLLEMTVGTVVQYSLVVVLTERMVRIWPDSLKCLVPEGGLEPPQAQGSSDFESDASTSSTTPALVSEYYQSSECIASEEPFAGFARHAKMRLS